MQTNLSSRFGHTCELETTILFYNISLSNLQRTFWQDEHLAYGIHPVFDHNNLQRLRFLDSVNLWIKFAYFKSAGIQTTKQWIAWRERKHNHSNIQVYLLWKGIFLFQNIIINISKNLGWPAGGEHIWIRVIDILMQWNNHINPGHNQQ